MPGVFGRDGGRRLGGRRMGGIREVPMRQRLVGCPVAMEERWSTRLDPRTPRGVTAGAGRNIVKPKRGATEGKTHTHTFTTQYTNREDASRVGGQQTRGRPA